MKEAMPVLSAGAGELHKCKHLNKHTYVCTVTMTLTDLCLHVGLHETLALLTSQLRPDANHKEDMVFLKDVFSERSLSYLMKVCTVGFALNSLAASYVMNDSLHALFTLAYF